MELKIPVLASQAGIVVGGVVFTLVSKTGQASTYVIEQGTSLTALALGATMELVAGPVVQVEDPLTTYELKEEGEFMTLLLPDDPVLLKDTAEK